MLANLSMRSRVSLVFTLIVLCVAAMGGVALQRVRDLGASTHGLQDNAATLIQFGTFSADFERLARLDVTGQLPMPAAAHQRLLSEETDIRRDMDSQWSAYSPTIAPGEEAARAAALKSAWERFGALEQQLDKLEQQDDHPAAAALILGDFSTAASAFRQTIDAAVGFQDSQARAIAAGADATVASSYTWVIALFLLALVVAVSAALLTIFGDVRLIRTITAAMTRLAGNDLATAIPGAGRSDEIGAMAGAVQVFKDSMIAREKVEAEIAEQRRTAEQQRAEREGRERQAIAEISGLCDRIADGDLDRRLDEAGKDGFLLTLCQRLNGLTGMLQQITAEMATVTSGMAEGDLTSSVEGSYRGVFGTLKTGVNAMAEKLRGFALQLQQSAATVRAAAAEISTGSQDLAQRTESQAASVEETAASMHEITTTVKQNAENAAAANQLAGSARQSAEKGGSVVREAVAAVSQIEQSARKIADIVGLIDEIAFQTNLLALNASVEAARAGEAGKGFAVVAQEVRALAQRSANASKDIKTLITESNAQVKTGADLVNQAGTSLDGIVGAIKKVSEIVAEIAAASREQATGLEQINTAVGQMDEMTQRNGALVEETSASAQSLADQARQLSELVGFFRIDRTAPALRLAS